MRPFRGALAALIKHNGIARSLGAWQKVLADYSLFEPGGGTFAERCGFPLSRTTFLAIRVIFLGVFPAEQRLSSLASSSLITCGIKMPGIFLPKESFLSFTLSTLVALGIVVLNVLPPKPILFFSDLPFFLAIGPCLTCCGF
jgi:hypothetical protein